VIVMKEYHQITHPRLGPRRHQQGVVLIVCLVLLLVVTGLGLATMRGTGLEMKMAGGLRDRAVAFETAEQTLRVAEKWLDSKAMTQINSFADGCAGDTCFNAACANGLCVFYDPANLYLSGDHPAVCGSRLKPPTTQAWRWRGATNEPNLWLDSNKHVAVTNADTTLHPNLAVSPKYFVEFLCYTDQAGVVCDTSNSPNSCAPLFRVTALTTGLVESTKVMLQSIYKKVI
tara:strand:+ start:129953 stop:130642 length:690 start_codon:yes stop_codon:yes gene_type:complete